MNVNASGLDALMTSVRRQVEKKWKMLERANREAAEFGAQTARSYTRSRPGATTGKAGRVDTGAMVSALNFKFVESTPGLIRSQYGFTADYDVYMKLQTVTGFRHNRSSRYIAPTFALRDSIDPTKDFAKAAARSSV